MSSPELDRVFWQDEGWKQLSRHLSRTVIHSPPPPAATQLASASKRSASLAGLDLSPTQSSLSASTGSSSSLNYLRRRKRSRMSSYEDAPAAVPVSVAGSTSSRALQERITELARRLSTQSTASPLHDKTNVKRAVPPKTGSGPEARRKTGHSPAISGHRPARKPDQVDGDTKRALPKTSPPRPARPFVKTFSGPLQPSAPTSRAHAPAFMQRLPLPTAACRADNPPKEIETVPTLLAGGEAGNEDDELEEGDSFEALLSQIPVQQLDAMLAGSSQSNAKPDGYRASPLPIERPPILGLPLSQEAAAALCAGVGDLSDFEDV